MILVSVHGPGSDPEAFRSSLASIADVEIYRFASATSALGWARERRADLVVVEHAPPHLDAPAFIDHLRALQEHEFTIVLVLAPDLDRDSRRRAARAGANEILTGPFERDELVERVRNALLLAQRRRELLQRANAALASQELETLFKLARAAEFRDDVTGMHIVRVGHMCAAVGRALGLHERECDVLGKAAPMHDIGKVAVPDRILLKPGPLNAAEMEIMRRHAAAGYEILKGGDSPTLRCAAEIALTHHERFDGQGYPNGLRGERIPLSGRICSAVDVFDALTSERPYKSAWPLDRAVEQLVKGSGAHFDPDVVAAFHDAFPEVCTIRERFGDTGRLAPAASDS